jgi:hypothetical protein
MLQVGPVAAAGWLQMSAAPRLEVHLQGQWFQTMSLSCSDMIATNIEDFLYQPSLQRDSQAGTVLSAGTACWCAVAHMHMLLSGPATAV